MFGSFRRNGVRFFKHLVEFSIDDVSVSLLAAGLCGVSVVSQVSLVVCVPSTGARISFHDPFHFCKVDISVMSLLSCLSFSFESSFLVNVVTSLLILLIFQRTSFWFQFLWILVLLVFLFREREAWICCFTYSCTHWPVLKCALTRDGTCGLG